MIDQDDHRIVGTPERIRLRGDLVAGATLLREDRKLAVDELVDDAHGRVASPPRVAPEIDDEAFQEHAQGAKVGCPVSRALSATPMAWNTRSKRDWSRIGRVSKPGFRHISRAGQAALRRWILSGVEYDQISSVTDAFLFCSNLITIMEYIQAETNKEKSCLVLYSFLSESFCDVSRHGNSCPSELCRKAESFFFRKRFC